MTLVAPHIVNDASYVTRIKRASHFYVSNVARIKHASHSEGQAQYLVKFEDAFAEQSSTVWYGVVLE